MLNQFLENNQYNRVSSISIVSFNVFFLYILSFSSSSRSCHVISPSHYHCTRSKRRKKMKKKLQAWIVYLILNCAFLRGHLKVNHFSLRFPRLKQGWKHDRERYFVKDNGTTYYFARVSTQYKIDICYTVTPLPYASINEIFRPERNTF